jgi:hypothetical protein
MKTPRFRTVRELHELVNRLSRMVREEVDVAAWLSKPIESQTCQNPDSAGSTASS